MKLEAKDITSDLLISVPDYVKEVAERTKNEKLTKNTITYQLANTDNLDYVVIGKKKFIVINSKSKKFTPGENYGSSKTKEDKMQF